MTAKAKRFLTLNIILALSALTTAVSCCIFSAQTLDYRLDKYYYSLNNYNTQTRLDEYQPPILKCHSTEKNDENNQMELFKSSFDTFHYNIMAQSNALEVSSKTSIVFSDTTKPIKLLTQPRFWISRKDNIPEGYFLEYGQYLTYFDRDVIKNGPMYEPRYGADSFVFISDVLADELINKHGIKSSSPYEELINNPEYSLLTFDNDDTGIPFSLSINNVVHTKYRKAPTTVELYGDAFGLICFNGEMNKLLELSLSISLKTNPYTFKTVVQTILAQLGSEKDHVDFEIFPNQSSGNSSNKLKSAELNSILKKKNRDNLFTSLFYFTLIAGVTCFSVVLFKILEISTKRETFFISGIVFCCFVIYGVISNFVYVYPLFSVPLLSITIVALLASMKKASIGTKLIFDEMVPYYEIDI